ncbi:MAG: trehalose-phosphatase [Bdellovibrio sp.]|nr:MAG: trehalose-phosphatase [Bdellovibrio sp.]
MRSLLSSSKNRNFLRSHLDSRTLLAFDFDGTLAPIANDPYRARLRASTARLLSELCGVAPVAVISGRGVRDLKEKVPSSIQLLSGNHGLEAPGVRSRTLRRMAQVSSKWKQQLLKQMKQVEFDTTGILVEDKEFSLSIHYRSAKQRTKVKAALLAMVGHLNPKPRIVLGKFIVNVVAPESPHKGDALLSIMKKVKAKRAVYVGDDDNDEDVFVLKNPRLLTVRVGARNSSKAKYYIKNQRSIDELLGLMIQSLKKSSVD